MPTAYRPTSPATLIIAAQPDHRAARLHTSTAGPARHLRHLRQATPGRNNGGTDRRGMDAQADAILDKATTVIRRSNYHCTSTNRSFTDGNRAPHLDRHCRPHPASSTTGHRDPAHGQAALIALIEQMRNDRGADVIRVPRPQTQRLPPTMKAAEHNHRHARSNLALAA